MKTQKGDGTLFYAIYKKLVKEGYSLSSMRFNSVVFYCLYFDLTIKDVVRIIKEQAILEAELCTS